MKPLLTVGNVRSVADFKFLFFSAPKFRANTACHDHNGCTVIVFFFFDFFSFVRSFGLSFLSAVLLWRLLRVPYPSRRAEGIGSIVAECWLTTWVAGWVGKALFARMGAGGSRFDPREEEDTIDNFVELFKAVSGEWSILLEIMRKIGENKQLATDIVVYLSNCPDIARKVRVKHSFAPGAEYSTNATNGEDQGLALAPDMVESGFELWTGSAKTPKNEELQLVVRDVDAAKNSSEDHGAVGNDQVAGCFVVQTGSILLDGLYSAVDSSDSTDSDQARVKGFKFVKSLKTAKEDQASVQSSTAAQALVLQPADKRSASESQNSSSSEPGCFRGGEAWGEPNDECVELVAVETAASLALNPPCPEWAWQLRGSPSKKVLLEAQVSSIDPPSAGLWVTRDRQPSPMAVFRDTGSMAGEANTRTSSHPRQVPQHLEVACADSAVARVVAAQQALDQDIEPVTAIVLAGDFAANKTASSNEKQLTLRSVHHRSRQFGREYYQAVQASSSTIAMFQRIKGIIDAFLVHVQATAKQIVEAQFLPLEEQVLKPLPDGTGKGVSGLGGPASRTDTTPAPVPRGTQVYITGGVRFSLLRGTAREFAGDYAAEAKTAKHELLACDYSLPHTINTPAASRSSPLVVTPLVAVVDFLGFRVLAESIDVDMAGSNYQHGSEYAPSPMRPPPPVCGTVDGGLSFATPDGAETSGIVGDEAILERMTGIADSVGLAPHFVGEIGPRLVRRQTQAVVVADPAAIEDRHHDEEQTSMPVLESDDGVTQLEWVDRPRCISCPLAATVLGYRVKVLKNGPTTFNKENPEVERCLARLGRMFPAESPLAPVQQLYDRTRPLTTQPTTTSSASNSVSNPAAKLLSRQRSALMVQGWSQESARIQSRRLRPEWVSLFANVHESVGRLSADAFSKFARVDEKDAGAHNDRVHAATMELLTVQAHKVANVLQELAPSLVISTADCDCKARKGSDPRPKPNSSVQPPTDERSTEPIETSMNATQGISPQLAQPWWLDIDQVSKVLHAHGMNCRHLGILARVLVERDNSARREQIQERKRLKMPELENPTGDPAAAALAHGLVRCMTVRTLKQLLRAVQRDCCNVTLSTSQQSVRSATAHFVNLCAVESSLSKHFWDTQVAPALARAFGVGILAALQFDLRGVCFGHDVFPPIAVSGERSKGHGTALESPEKGNSAQKRTGGSIAHPQRAKSLASDRAHADDESSDDSDDPVPAPPPIALLPKTADQVRQEEAEVARARAKLLEQVKESAKRAQGQRRCRSKFLSILQSHAGVSLAYDKIQLHLETPTIPFEAEDVAPIKPTVQGPGVLQLAAAHSAVAGAQTMLSGIDPMTGTPAEWRNCLEHFQKVYLSCRP